MTLAHDPVPAAQEGAAPRPWASPGRVAYADAVRRLVEASVTSMADDVELRRVAELLAGVASDLEIAGPGDVRCTGDRQGAGGADPGGTGPVPRFDADAGITDGEAMTRAMPFDVVVGVCNPLAPPLSVWFEPPLARAAVTFGPAHEGAPGCVHGAMIASAFDVVLTAANVVAGAAGPTVDLTIRYRRPTLVGVEALFEARAVEVDQRRITSTGTLTQDGVVRVEATGTFAVFDRDRILAHHRGSSRSSPPGTGPSLPGIGR
ncbi:MAG: PaaI family thioesterase [Actinomycetota bacterium]|nr:PaaI family thioesterase [Actinomycetota bacterium]